MPEEPLDHGFDISVAGEGEEAILHLVEYAEGGRDLASIPGVYYRAENGSVRSGPPRRLLSDLDGLPFPHLAHVLFDPAWYRPDVGEFPPGGVVASRGCPARCSFCANFVTGRRVRHRSPANVIAELNDCHRKTHVEFYPFWDDAFTADHAWVLQLCEAIDRDTVFPCRWSVATRADFVSAEVLAAMRKAGCTAVNFGLESGDEHTLRSIRKGLCTERSVQAVRWAHDQELITTANFMLGFPGESPGSLDNTLRFMEKITPYLSFFGMMGVVVPLPGTPLYEEHHREYGFTDWWLRDEYDIDLPDLATEDFGQIRHHYTKDPALELDYFHYTPEQRRRIVECLEFKGEHNFRKMGIGYSRAREATGA